MPHLAPLLVTAALALSACASPVVSLAPPARTASAGDYADIYERWTRAGRTISKVEFDTTLMVSATLRSPEFQDAYCARHIKLYDLRGAEADALREAETRRGAETLTFAVQALGHSYGWTDLTTTRSLWRVYLSDDSGRMVSPTAVESPRSHKLTEATALFDHPLAGPYARTFQLVFPRLGADGQPLLSPTARRLTLTFTGPGGRIDLHWTLR